MQAAAAVAEAKKPSGAALPAMATLPFDTVPLVDALAEAAVEVADDGARALFGPPNLSKATAPPLLPCVTGSGHGPTEGVPGARSPAGDSDCSSPVSPPPTRAAPPAPAAASKRHRSVGGGQQAAAQALPDDLWLQEGPLPLPLLGGAGDGLQGQEQALEQEQQAQAGADPFNVGSAEEAAMWHDVLQFYLGEDEEGLLGAAGGAVGGGLGGGAGVGAAAGGWADEEEPGFGWER